MKPMVFEYNGVQAEVDEDALHKAAAEMEEQIDEADTLGESRDGITFCGCPDCYGRVVSGFWVSWTIKAIQDKVLVPVHVPSQ